MLQSGSASPSAPGHPEGRLSWRPSFILSQACDVAPPAFGTETFSSLNDLLPGLRKMRGIHEPSFGERRVPYGQIMSVTFLAEVGLVILIGML